ncbi:MAG: hypothetical protein HYR49_10745 [Gammaproteobacteria bacterium]|nr:hypothetical protein [Gammaproteobacteria bacterium]
MRLTRNAELILQLILAAGTLALAGVLVVELRARPVEVKADSGAKLIAEAPAAPVPDARPFPPVQEYAAITERPLFSPDRKAQIATAAPTAGAAQLSAGTTDPAEMILTAVVITNERPLAILETARGKGVHKIAVGEAVNGWTLAEIQPEAVVLEKGSEVRTLELRIQGSPAAGKKTAPPLPKQQEPPKEAQKEVQNKESKAVEVNPAPAVPPKAGDDGN